MSSTTPPTRTQPILILGAGELALSILTSVITHPNFSPTTTPLTLALRPSTYTTPSPTLTAALEPYTSTNRLTLLSLDLSSPTATLTDAFRPYHTVIHAAGMTSPPGTQLGITKAAVAAGVSRYVPWQFGVDYDILGPEAGGGLFGEQCEVRKVLRDQTQTGWVVLSCGVFMSFLFEEFWGVVTKPKEEEAEDGEGRKKVRVRALGGWEDGITVTEAGDIGRVMAALALDDEGEDKRWDDGEVVFIAGDMLTYEELAGVVGKVMGREVVRELWDREWLKGKMEENAEDKLWKYRVVFGGGKGVSWPVEGTWSQRRGMKMVGVEEWLRKNWRD